MNGRWKMVTEPTIEPVTVEEAKTHLNITHSEDDALIGTYISAARQLCESRTGRAFVTQTQDLYLDGFPVGPIQVRRPPLSSVTSITYVDDDDGSTATLSSTAYIVDTVSEPARITPAYNDTWPGTRQIVNAVKVRCVLGYGTTDIPTKAKQAIKLLVGNWYANRENIVVGTIQAKLDFTVDALLDTLDWGKYA